MKVKHTYVDFKISRRTLWVGSKAYPLHMITSVEPIEVTPNRTWIATEFLKQAGATIGLGIVGSLVLSCMGTSAPRPLWTVLALVVSGLLAIHIVRLVNRLKLGSVYILSVRNAGTRHAALVSTNRKLISDLTFRVVDAIDNPKAEFELRVDHLDIVHGDKVFGDKVLGDKVLDGWGG
jgi:hypothetical protein